MYLPRVACVARVLFSFVLFCFVLTVLHTVIYVITVISRPGFDGRDLRISAWILHTVCNKGWSARLAWQRWHIVRNAQLSPLIKRKAFSFMGSSDIIHPLILFAQYSGLSFSHNTYFFLYWPWTPSRDPSLLSHSPGSRQVWICFSWQSHPTDSHWQG